MIDYILRRLKADFSLIIQAIPNKISLANIHYLPRWIVLAIDILVVFIANLFTYIMLRDIGIKLILEFNYAVYAFLFYCGITLFFFWMFRTYSGIIRHSTFIDAIKIFLSQLGVFVVMLLINTGSNILFDQKLFLNTRLFFNTVLVFCGLMLYRIIIKQVFEQYLFEDRKDKLTPVLIYGSDTNAVTIANALKVEVPRRFNVLGFISSDTSSIMPKRILDLPLFSLQKKVSATLFANGAEGIILADKSINNDEKLETVEDCLNNHFKVYYSPLITNWEDQKNISNKVKSIEIQDLLERKPIVLDSKSISAQVKNKTIMVTGAAGSIGSEIVWQLCKFEPLKIILIDQAETPLHNLNLELEKKVKNIQLCSIIADVRDKEAMQQILELHKPNIIYHAAAYKHVPLMEKNPCQAIRTNIMGTKNMADLAVAYNVERFVMISTDKAVNPSNVMGASKRIAEKYIQFLQKESATKFITTRFGNVLGSNGSVVPLFTKQIENGGPITITHPDVVRYFMTIPEACQLVLEAAAMGNGGEIYMFNMGNPVKIIDLATKMIQMAGLRPEKDIKIKIIGLRPGEKLYEELLNGDSKRLPTHHEKITIAIDETNNLQEINTRISYLYKNINNLSKIEMVAIMKELVPEFISLNSEFEILDNPKKIA